MISGSAGYPPTFLQLPGPVQGGGIRAGTLDGDSILVANNSIQGCTYDGGISQIQGVSSGAGISSGDVRLVNSTITGNFALQCGPPFQPAQGIGISGAALQLDQVTVADNLLGNAISAAQLTSQRSVVIADPNFSACQASAGTGSSSYNWFSDASCQLTGTANQQAPAAFLLGPLADNGGPVQTRLPGPASALINRIPTSACPIRVDARGISRPQGPACDIGAVELQSVAGQGPSNLALSFTNPPVSLIPGKGATWTLTVANCGPNSTPVAVAFDIPDVLSLQPLTASGGGVCQFGKPAVCTWSTISPSSSQTVTLVADFLGDSFAPVTLRASVSAPQLSAPFTDDTASVSTPVVVDAKVRFTFTSIGPQIDVRLINDGPYAAIGTSGSPIELDFSPAPGVLVGSTSNVLTGTYPSGLAYFAGPRFSLKFAGTPPAVLGTLTLHPGPNTLSGSATQSVMYAPAPDLAVRMHRSTASTAPGSAVSFNVEVVNVGGSPAQNPSVALLDGNPATKFTFSPTIGDVSSGADVGENVWSIPATLAPGQSVTLQASALNTGAGELLVADLSSTSPDFNDRNQQSGLDIGPAPNGFADLAITALGILPGANVNQRIVRATFANLGPATASYSSGGSQVVSLLNPDGLDLVGVSVLASASSSDWSCVPLSQSVSPSCKSTKSFPVGSSAIFDFIVNANFATWSFHPIVRLDRFGALTLDPEPDDNERAAP